MPVIETYSKRRRRLLGQEPEVHVYDALPAPLRVQICFILKSTLGPYWEPFGYGSVAPPNNSEAWRSIHKLICRELGREQLAGRDNPDDDVLDFIKHERDIDHVLSAIELAFSYAIFVHGRTSRAHWQRLGIEQSGQDAVDELNARFQEHGVGYSLEHGEIVRVDNRLLHSEVVKPALSLLSDHRFAAAQEEYIKAHEHHRGGNDRESITAANGAFESTMKIICDIQGWTYGKGARASDLIKVLRANSLLPEYLERSFDQLAATLKSGLPEVRNEESSAHGAGAKKRETPQYVASYALHLAAANIVFLIEALKDFELSPSSPIT